MKSLLLFVCLVALLCVVYGEITLPFGTIKSPGESATFSSATCKSVSCNSETICNSTSSTDSNVNVECSIGFYCNGVAKECIRKSLSGETCASDAECYQPASSLIAAADFKCINKKCEIIRNRQPGERCSADNQCVENSLCLSDSNDGENDAKCSYIEENKVCYASSAYTGVCKSGLYCDTGTKTCKALKASGASCTGTMPGECGWLLCGYHGNLAVGGVKTCGAYLSESVDKQCVSNGNCADGMFCNSGGLCKKGTTATCTTNADCVDNKECVCAGDGTRVCSNSLPAKCTTELSRAQTCVSTMDTMLDAMVLWNSHTLSLKTCNYNGYNLNPSSCVMQRCGLPIQCYLSCMTKVDSLGENCAASAADDFQTGVPCLPFPLYLILVVVYGVIMSFLIIAALVGAIVAVVLLVVRKGVITDIEGQDDAFLALKHDEGRQK